MVSQIMTKCFPAEICSMGALLAINRQKAGSLDR
jgi:hypothetical protein